MVFLAWQGGVFVVVVTVVVGVLDIVLEVVLDVEGVLLVVALVLELDVGAEFDSWVEDVREWVAGGEE